jgi:murein DD-endopeptidase MepM/ murein hydrolase activator NlpD
LSNPNDERLDDVVTLMYVPGPAANIRRFNLRRRWIRRAAVAALVAVAATGTLAVDYVQVRRQLTELGQLRTETEEQRDQLLEYADKMKLISTKLTNISRLDRKLRIITNMDPADPLPLRGIGGIEGATLEPYRLTGLTRERRNQRMLESFDRLAEAADLEEESLAGLIAHLEDQTSRLVKTPSISPTKGWVTSAFGYRTSPFTGNREFHRGLDIAGRMGTPIVAPADAEVRFVGRQRALGNTVILRHGFGVETIYGHLSEMVVKRGQKVKRGERIALMGNTGRSTGPHLHYQVDINGVAANPQNYILD